MPENKKTPQRIAAVETERASFDIKNNTGNDQCQQNSQNYIVDLLPHGAENAVSGTKLAALCGFKDTRILRHAVTEARLAGCAILSDSRGYYLPSTDEKTKRAEIEKFVRIMAARLRSTSEVIHGVKNALKASGMSDQCSIFDIDG